MFEYVIAQAPAHHRALSFPTGAMLVTVSCDLRSNPVLLGDERQTGGISTAVPSLPAATVA